MSDLAISVNNLGKRYRIGTKRPYGSLAESITETLRKPFCGLTELFGKRDSGQPLWALKDINFDIERNEIVGVIGRNGSGKSTLLKILSGVTEPTEGRAEITGRSSSLLEVGTGFHPELTGRENVYLNGTILGMKKREIDAKFDEIVSFSEIERFIDTPVKRYSSGMAVRLAFAVAAHLEPEILMVDEVLAVGDLKFQRKCLNKMHDVVQHGKTILFVTHQMNSVRRLCNKCIWLDQGTIKMTGPTATVVAAYEAASLSRSFDPILQSDNSSGSRFLSWGLAKGEVGEPHIYDKDGPITLRVIVQTDRQINYGHHGLGLWDARDELMWSYDVDNVNLEPGVYEFLHTLPSLPLRPGNYRWHFNLHDSSGMLDEWYGVPEMIVATEPVTHPSDECTGILNIPCKSNVERLR